MVEEEMKIQLPRSRRKEVLFYLELETLAQDCKIDKLGPEPILCHLLVRGLLGSAEKLKERIIVDSE